MARKNFVGGNWKCNGTIAKLQELTKMLNNVDIKTDAVDVVVAPIAIHLSLAKDALQSNVQVCAQNVSKTGCGAYTGEIAIEQYLDLGIKWVLTGHSERRAYFQETDEIIAEKTKRALEVGAEADVNVIFCIGESLEQREANETFNVVKRQMIALKNVITEEQWKRVVVAYEPVWAIGTGVVATPAQAQEVHAELRAWLKSEVSQQVADTTRIIYGGSVNAGNCKDLIALEDVDGFLVGGASLKPEFEIIIQSAQ